MADDRGGPVAVLNRTAAERFWPGEDPIGRRLRYPRGFPPEPDDDTPWITVVGVAGDVRSRSLQEAPRPAIYVPHAQSPREDAYPGRTMTLVVSTDGDPLALTPALRAAVRELDPALPLARVVTMEGVLAASLGQARSTSWLMGLFALVALLLAAIGVYGVVAFSVRRRRPELGLRLGFGARRVDIVRQVAGEGLAQAAVGVVIGLAAARAASRLLSGLLHGVDATDPATYAGVAALLLTVALGASTRPALRAARVDPAETLRAE